VNSEVIEIKCSTNFKIHSYFLNNLYKFFGFKSPLIDEYSSKKLFLNKGVFVQEYMKIAFELIYFIIKKEITGKLSPKNGIFLIFLPGLGEIVFFSNYLHEMFEKLKFSDF